MECYAERPCGEDIEEANEAEEELHVDARLVADANLE